MTNAVLAINNLLETGTVSASTETAGFPIENAFDGIPNDFWQPTSSAKHQVNVDMGLAVSVDLFGFYSSDFYSFAGATCGLYYSDDGIAYTLVDTITASLAGPKLKLVASSSHQYWRIQFDTTAAQVPKIQHVYLGTQTEMQRGLGSGLQPMNLGSENLPITSESANGHFIGRSTIKMPIKTRLSFANMTPAWMTTNWPSILSALESKAFMVLVSPDSYPDEAAFSWITGDIKTPKYSALNLVSFSLHVDSIAMFGPPPTLVICTPWDLSAASYDGVSFSVTTESTNTTGLAFKSDGSKMYIVNRFNRNIYQYTLSTAWDLSTASYDSVSFSVSAQDGNPSGLAFKSDGSKMYITGDGNDLVYQYTLSTAWDLSTASYDGVSFDISSQEGFPTAIAFKTDGLKMYIVGSQNDTVYQYTLSTAWDLSTASYDSVSFSVSAQEGLPTAFAFKSDGSKMYVAGVFMDTVFQYSLSTAWDLSTASYDSVSFSVSAQDGSVGGLAFKLDGLKMYVAGIGNDAVYQYSIENCE